MYRLENLNTIKEEKTRISFKLIESENLNSLTKSGFYVSAGWSNDISGLPDELHTNGSKAFYLLVFSLDSDNYCQQVLFSFKGLIFYRVKSSYNIPFEKWRKIQQI